MDIWAFWMYPVSLLYRYVSAVSLYIIYIYIYIYMYNICSGWEATCGWEVTPPNKFGWEATTLVFLAGKPVVAGKPPL